MLHIHWWGIAWLFQSAHLGWLLLGLNRVALGEGGQIVLVADHGCPCRGSKLLGPGGFGGLVSLVALLGTAQRLDADLILLERFIADLFNGLLEAG